MAQAFEFDSYAKTATLRIAMFFDGLFTDAELLRSKGASQETSDAPVLRLRIANW